MTDERDDRRARRLGERDEHRMSSGSLCSTYKDGHELGPCASMVCDRVLGLLFHIKPDWAPYDMLGAEREEVLPTSEIVSIQSLGAVKYVELFGTGRRHARISQRGPDTDRIDWLYRIHYLQWTGNKTIDRALAVGGLALIWAVMIPGVVFVQRLQQNRRRAGLARHDEEHLA